MTNENFIVSINYYNEKMRENYTKILEDAIIRFLRENGYKPRKNIKYFINLNKKLRKKGLLLQIEIITNYNYDINEAEITKKYILKNFKRRIKMNRIIKFRGKIKDKKRAKELNLKVGDWVYGYYFHDEGLQFIDGESKEFDRHYIINTPYPEEWIEVIPETIGQFTGLYDKKRKRNI